MIDSFQDDLNDILSRFPKCKPPLPKSYQSIYLKLYTDNRDGQSIVASLRKRLESWMHVRVSELQTPGNALLELGSGLLNHLYYEKDYDQYDVVEPLLLKFKQEKTASIDSIFADIEEIDYSKRYERIFSIAVLEHLEHLPLVIAKSALLLEEGGKFQAAVPCEGHFLWHIANRVVTGVSFRAKYGLDYNVIMDYEHVNTCHEIIALVRFFFSDVKVKTCLNLPFSLSLYAYIEASNPRLKDASDYLKVHAS